MKLSCSISFFEQLLSIFQTEMTQTRLLHFGLVSHGSIPFLIKVVTQRFNVQNKSLLPLSTLKTHFFPIVQFLILKHATLILSL